MNTGQTIGTIDGRRGHGLDSAKSVLQWRFQRRMPDMESGEKHHPIEAGQGVGTLCQSTALRAWHRGLHWRTLHWAPMGAVGHGVGARNHGLGSQRALRSTARRRARWWPAARPAQPMRGRSGWPCSSLGRTKWVGRNDESPALRGFPFGAASLGLLASRAHIPVRYPVASVT